MTLGDDATFGMRIDPAPSVEAPLVFAGHGLQIPEVKHDDFAGLDVKGKVVVLLSGSPSSVPGALERPLPVRRGALEHAEAARRHRHHLDRQPEEHGRAVGALVAQPPQSRRWRSPTPSLDDTAGQQVSIAFNPARAERLFEGSGHTFAEMLKIADEGKALPHFPLPISVRAKVAVENQDVESHNVAGIVRGSDPTLAGEFVVLTAHLDHVGVGAPINGDSIYNGAMDNASGIATLIESRVGRSPGRSRSARWCSSR